MSRFRPPRLPWRARLVLVAALGVTVTLVAAVYAAATVWLVATGGFEGWW